MSLVCAISGTTPEIPVLSKTGFIFERRLIEKHIDLHGKCPISGEDLAKDELSVIRFSKIAKPRPVNATSIPGLLSMFQNEWDALMTETFELRSDLDAIRNQLSQTLYQHDAATRVIARLLKERDASRQQVIELQNQLFSARTTDLSEVEVGISGQLLTQMQDLAKKLLETRKKRKIDNIATPEQIQAYKNTCQFPLHSASTPGILCCDIDPKNEKRIATGGADHVAVYFDLEKQKTIARLQGHVKRVNSVKIHPSENLLLSASDDKSIRIWKGEQNDQFKCAHIIRKFHSEVTSLSLHPLHSHFVGSSNDRSWALFDFESGKCLQSCKDLTCCYKSFGFHPDGMILAGGGDDSDVHIWDMKGLQLRARLSGHKAPIVSLAFSENGYYLVTSSLDETVRLWDLRKSSTFQTIEMESGCPMGNVTFDYSGQYVALASSAVNVYNFESRSSVVPAATFHGHSQPVTDVKFGPRASYLISTSLDRTVRLWEASN